MAGSGASDTNLCADGKEVWIELKERTGNKIKVRGSQIGWTEKRLNAGGRVWVLVLCEDQRVDLYHGKYIKWLGKPAVLPKIPVQYSICFPYHWAPILSLLFE